MNELEPVMATRELHAKTSGEWRGFVLFNRVLAVLLAVVLVVPALLSVEWLEQHAVVCPLRMAGLPCPSCGLTRSLAALYAGDFAASRAFHPAATWLVAAVAVELGARPLVERLARRYGPVVFVVDLGQLCLSSMLAGLAAGRGLGL